MAMGAPRGAEESWSQVYSNILAEYDFPRFSTYSAGNWSARLHEHERQRVTSWNRPPVSHSLTIRALARLLFEEPVLEITMIDERSTQQRRPR
jgi:hypothetical protein